MEKFSGEQHEKPTRNINDPGTFEAIAQIEGPEWVALQDTLAHDDGKVNRGYYETSFQRAIDRLGKGTSEIRGNGGLHHWLVSRNGEVCFVSQQAASQELLDRVRELGFEITS